MPKSKIILVEVTCPDCNKKFKTKGDYQQHHSAKHHISNDGRTKEKVKKVLYFCSDCNSKLKSNSELERHKKEKVHLLVNELMALLLKHFGNTDVHKDAISFIQNLKSKRQKREKSILPQVIEEMVIETGQKDAILDLYILLVKFNPGNSKYLDLLGNIYAEYDDYKNAIATYKKAMKLTKNKSFIQSKLLTLYFKTEDQENVTAAISKIIPSRPYVNQARLDLKIKKDWKRLKSELISQNEKKPNIPEKILNEKLRKFERCEKQYLFWYLNHPSTQKEVAVLNRFINTIKAKFMHEIDSVIHYRTFVEKNNTSIHIKAIRRDWGFAIKIHRDLFKHQHAIFDKKCLEVLSKLYIFLTKKKGGDRFILPRQEKNFQSFLGNRFNKNFKYK